MRSGRIRATTAVLVLVTVAGAAACGGLFKKDYEYEEELYLAIDGSATVNVNASIASLVALRGAPLDPDPRSRPDRHAVRMFFAAPGVEVRTPTFSRRDGRRFVHVSLDVPDVHGLARLRAFAWSDYRFDRHGESFVYRQTVGKASGRSLAAADWRDDAMIAFRVHVPSQVLFENATSDVQRGNILIWEQSLSERLAGAPLDLHVEMEPESILRATLLLFGATALAAAGTFAVVVWWVIRRGRAANARDLRSPSG